MIRQILSLIFISALFLGFTSKPLPTNSSYGVFVGASPSSIEKFYNFDKIIIDAQYYDNKHIESLHNNNVKVYSYLNIGSVENFRPYYNKLVDITLSDYENWPEERWLDLSSEMGRDYLVDVVAKDLFDKGIDGFFLDNVDVYYIYNNAETYEGILDILTRLKENYNLSIIVNGGFEFFQTSINNNLNISNLVDGINHESVFTKIDFDNNRLVRNTRTERLYLLEYFKQFKEHDIQIYVIEYTKSNHLSNKIAYYYNKIGYEYYITNDISLE
jgi:hypothetical protein